MAQSAMQKSEFRVQGLRSYNRDNAVRWMISHLLRHWPFLLAAILFYIATYSAFSYARVLYGDAADAIVNSEPQSVVVRVSLLILILLVSDGLLSLGGALSLETLANRFERDARHELYASLIGKSQTFHDQQRVGDVMARATDDVRQLNATISPGVLFMLDITFGFAMPTLIIGLINPQLLLVPLLFLGSYVAIIRRYTKRLEPVIDNQREQFGVLNAGLEETISGIEIVKVAAREAFERDKFNENARQYREHFVQQGRIEAGYLPLLIFGIAFGLMFLHTFLLYRVDLLSFGDIISVMSLMSVLRFPVFISLFGLSLIQLGISSSRRIINLMEQESDIDENAAGHQATLAGAITFESVTFGYGAHPVLQNVSFAVEAGQTIAIVGQTGAGKTTLTQLVGRTYDVQAGRVLIDGVDVRDWNLDSLRSQISRIEQDVFLFSRTIAENIAFGTPQATQEEIEQAAREAQAHDFILSFNEGYQTKIGERGVTLSGGQRQRLALARAFLKNPRILILDDSTSAIDSATEDEIQQAMRRAQQGRTTLLITHRLSQIRWADLILVLENGQLIASGTHDELLAASQHYRRIFARYNVAVPAQLSTGSST